MKQPGYRGGWNEEKVAVYLLRNTEYFSWRPSENGPPYWIGKDGTEFEMMDDDDDRWYATWKFVLDRGEVTRSDLATEFGHLMWASEPKP